MPTTATDHDDTTLRAIERWKITAAEEVDEIGGWRDAEARDRSDRYWSGASCIPSRRAEPPAEFYSQTAYLVGEITSRYPKLDPTALQDVYAAVAAWYQDRDPSRIPPQPVLFATLERAMMTLQAVEHDLESRLIYEDDRDLIQRLLEAKAPPRLTRDELSHLRAYLKAPARRSELQRNPAEGERRRKLKMILSYNDELRRVAGDSGPGTPPPEAPRVATHSPDFTSVDWFGTRYTFAKGNQATAMRALWEAWEGGGHSLTQETIREKVGSSDDHFKLAKVFRRRKPGGGYESHPAWRTIIQSDTRGSYRLVPPESP